MNILILSCGTRNKIIQYFKEAFTDIGHVIVTDINEIAPALYEADKYYIVPRMTEPCYIDIIMDICIKEKITGVLSLIDPELSLLAQHANAFKQIGTTVIGSPYELCELSLDKYEMYKWLQKQGFKCAQSFMSFDDFISSALPYPVFVKPAKGSASIAIGKAANEEIARFMFIQKDGMMLQENLNGQEIGADVYIDMLSGEVVSIFTKKKITMRAGETDKSVSFKDQKLFNLIEHFVSVAGYRGQIDIDIFEVNGEYYISEVNPRFGGGYPHAYECGCNHMKLILNNLSGVFNPPSIGNYKEDIYMMKYNEIMVK